MRTSAARARSSRPPGQGGVVGCALHSEQRQGFELIAIVSAGAGQHPQKKTTPVGFEPTRGDPIGLAGRRLNRSAKVSSAKPKDAMIVAQHAVSQHAVGVRGNWWSQVSV